MITVILLVLALVAFVAALARQDAPRVHSSPTPVIQPGPDEAESPSELALRDPVEALLRYGTPADAARLAEQGNDLSALGYRPPQD